MTMRSGKTSTRTRSSFSAKMFSGDNQAPQGYHDAGMEFGLNPGAGPVNIGDVTLSSGIFQPAGGRNYALALAYNGPAINFYTPPKPPTAAGPEGPVPDEGPTDMIFSYTLRVTACPQGTFPTRSGTCQEVRCPGNDDLANWDAREHLGMKLWAHKADGWTAQAGQPAQTNSGGHAPMVGPAGAWAPTVAAVDGTSSYNGDAVTVRGDPIMLVDCNTLAAPSRPLTNYFNVRPGKLTLTGALLVPGGAVLIAAAADAVANPPAPWAPGDARRTSNPRSIYVVPDVAAGGSASETSSGASILRRRTGDGGAIVLRFAVTYRMDVGGWLSLQTTVERQDSLAPPLVAGLGLALDGYSMDTSAAPPNATKYNQRYYDALRASASTITQPADLGGASKPVQALILPAGIPLPVKEDPEVRGELHRPAQHDEGHPHHRDRQWAMPDIHTNVNAATVVYSTAGRLEVFSSDHPNAPAAPMDASQAFSFDAFGGSVEVTYEPCAAGEAKALVIHGSSRLALPNIGSSGDPNSLIAAEFKLCRTSIPGDGTRTALRGVKLTFKSPVGIPIGNSGLFVTGLEGYVEINPDYSIITFDMDIQAAPGGNGGVFKGHGKVMIDTRGMFELQGGGKVLGVMDATGSLSVAWNPLDIELTMGRVVRRLADG